MNTMSLESLLITEEEWVATEGFGSAIKKAGSAVWGAIKTLCKKILNAIKTLIGKIKDRIGSIKRKKAAGGAIVGGATIAAKANDEKQPGPIKSSPQDERWKNINRDQFMKSKARFVGGVEIKLTQKQNPPTQTQQPQTQKQNPPTQTQQPQTQQQKEETSSSPVETVRLLPSYLMRTFLGKIDTVCDFLKEDIVALSRAQKSSNNDKSELMNLFGVDKIKAKIEKLNQDFPPIAKRVESITPIPLKSFPTGGIIKDLESCRGFAERTKRDIELILGFAEKIESDPDPRYHGYAILCKGIAILSARLVTYCDWQYKHLPTTVKS